MYDILGKYCVKLMENFDGHLSGFKKNFFRNTGGRKYAKRGNGMAENEVPTAQG